MLDKLIHAHLDKQEALEIEIEDDIDGLLRAVSIKKVIDNPEEALLAIIDAIKLNIKEQYAQQAIENGIQFAKDVQKKKADIKIQMTEDPKLNQDEFENDDKKQD